MPHSPVGAELPHDVAAERLDQQGERDQSHDVVDPERQQIRCRHGQGDARDGSHDLPPVTRRDRRPQPRHQPSGRHVRVPHQAEGEHPGPQLT